MDMEKGMYCPHRDGFIKAIRIYDYNSVSVVAKLVFTNGNETTISWEDPEERDMYAPGITTDTLIYDDREKPDFESFLENRKNIKSIYESYLIHLISNYSKWDLALMTECINKYTSDIVHEFKNKFLQCLNNKSTSSNVSEMIELLNDLVYKIDHPLRNERAIEYVTKD